MCGAQLTVIAKTVLKERRDPGGGSGSCVRSFICTKTHFPGELVIII